MPAPGNADRLSAPNDSRKNSSRRWPPRTARLHNSAGNAARTDAEHYLRRLADTDRSLARQVRELFS